MAFRLSIDGIPALEKELDRMNSIRWEAIRKKQTVELLNRARASGGTPVSTEATRPGGPHGELRLSSGTSGETMGYTKEYAFQSCGAYKTGQKRQKLSLRVA